MKPRVMIAGILGAAALMLGVSSTIAVASHQRDGAAPPPLRSASEPAAVERYSLRDVDGVIGVYHQGSLVYLTGIPVSGLPEEDRLLLREGLSVETYEELMGLLEDFSS